MLVPKIIHFYGFRVYQGQGSGKPGDGGMGTGRSRLFLIFGLLGVAVALIGFAKTFFLPVLTGTFRAPPIVYLHGALLFGWVGFFVVQAWLVHSRRLRLHRRIGWSGAAIAVGVIASTISVAVLASRRNVAAGNIVQAEAELLVVLIEMLVFGLLIGAALALRRKSETHKRLMLLALIASLGPAWFRFRHYFPEIGNPVFVYSLLIADSLIVIAALVDLKRTGQIHSVYWLVGTLLVLIHLLEVFGFESRPFQTAAAFLSRPLL